MELKDSFVGILGGQKWFRTHKTEPYVEIPPALIITDERGDAWTFGTDYVQPGANFEFAVMRNDVDTGEFASKIVWQQNKLRIYGRDGWRIWNGRTFI